jgi:hypothetical protein
MNSNNALYFAGGLVIGGVAGYLITDLLVYKFLEEGVEDDWTAEWNGFGPTKDDSVSSKNARIMSVDVTGPPEKDYSSIDIPEKEKLADLASQYSDISSPHIISIDQWLENPNDDFKKVAIYYTEDTTFAWQEGGIIGAPQNIFGPNIHLHFGESDGEDDPDVVYVAGPGNKTLYEIIQIHDAYEVKIDKKKPNATKAASKLAEEIGIDLNKVIGTGKGGSITMRDVQLRDVQQDGDDEK